MLARYSSAAQYSATRYLHGTVPVYNACVPWHQQSYKKFVLHHGEGGELQRVETPAGIFWMPLCTVTTCYHTVQLQCYTVQCRAIWFAGLGFAAADLAMPPEATQGPASTRKPMSGPERLAVSPSGQKRCHSFQKSPMARPAYRQADMRKQTYGTPRGIHLTSQETAWHGREPGRPKSGRRANPTSLASRDAMVACECPHLGLFVSNVASSCR